LALGAGQENPNEWLRPEPRRKTFRA
jgi:hypothetical protein